VTQAEGYDYNSTLVSVTMTYTHILSQTTGLVVATRLSEDPSVSVLVLEAGASNLNDPEIGIDILFNLSVSTHAMCAVYSANYGTHLRKPQYDWGFSTVREPFTIFVPSLI
jgi:choline dehydrogenase-like flavoprotein